MIGAGYGTATGNFQLLTDGYFTNTNTVNQPVTTSVSNSYRFSDIKD